MFDASEEMRYCQAINKKNSLCPYISVLFHKQTYFASIVKKINKIKTYEEHMIMYNDKKKEN